MTETTKIIVSDALVFLSGYIFGSARYRSKLDEYRKRVDTVLGTSHMLLTNLVQAIVMKDDSAADIQVHTENGIVTARELLIRMQKTQQEWQDRNAGIAGK
jgi:hypothetical protein